MEVALQRLVTQRQGQKKALKTGLQQRRKAERQAKKEEAKKIIKTGGLFSFKATVKILRVLTPDEAVVALEQLKARGIDEQDFVFSLAGWMAGRAECPSISSRERIFLGKVSRGFLHL